MKKKILQRIRNGWESFNHIWDVIEGALNKTTCANFLYHKVLPALYFSHTLATTLKARLIMVQRAMETSMLQF